MGFVEDRIEPIFSNGFIDDSMPRIGIVHHEFLDGALVKLPPYPTWYPGSVGSSLSAEVLMFVVIGLIILIVIRSDGDEYDIPNTSIRGTYGLKEVIQPSKISWGVR